jgi:hypothetical protein
MNWKKDAFLIRKRLDKASVRIHRDFAAQEEQVKKAVEGMFKTQNIKIEYSNEHPKDYFVVEHDGTLHRFDLEQKEQS